MSHFWRAIFGDNDNAPRSIPSGGEFLPVAKAIQQRVTGARGTRTSMGRSSNDIRVQNGLPSRDDVKKNRKPTASPAKPDEKKSKKSGGDDK